AGAVGGWSQAHQRFWKLPVEEIFGTAIYYAEHGYPVPEFIHGYWTDSLDKLKQTSEAQRIYLPHGKPPEIGEMFSNPDLAKALRLIADKRRDPFYKGEIAQAILKTSAALGGTMQADDLAEFSAEWVEPLSIDYRGWKIYELPPKIGRASCRERVKVSEGVVIQAEDGIRDPLVTGVQTCALPILRLIADKRRDPFYKGEIAQAILKTSAALGGTMQADDLAEFSAEWVEPLSIDYRGWKIYELPP